MESWLLLRVTDVLEKDNEKLRVIIDQLKAMCRSYKGVRLNPECCVLCSEKMEHNFGSLGVFRGTGVFSS